jgi:hypothetical protein
MTLFFTAKFTFAMNFQGPINIHMLARVTVSATHRVIKKDQADEI